MDQAIIVVELHLRDIGRRYTSGNWQTKLTTFLRELLKRYDIRIKCPQDAGGKEKVIEQIAQRFATSGCDIEMRFYDSKGQPVIPLSIYLKPKEHPENVRDDFRVHENFLVALMKQTALVVSGYVSPMPYNINWDQL